MNNAGACRSSLVLLLYVGNNVAGTKTIVYMGTCMLMLSAVGLACVHVSYLIHQHCGLLYTAQCTMHSADVMWDCIVDRMLHSDHCRVVYCNDFDTVTVRLLLVTVHSIHRYKLNIMIIACV